MKNGKLFLFATISLCLGMNGSVNVPKQPTVYQDQTALKVSLYLKDDVDATKKHLCDEFVIKAQNHAFWDQNNTQMYCLLSKDTVKYGKGVRSIHDFSHIIGGGPSTFTPETTKYAPLKNNKASFEKDNFIFECERITVKVPVQDAIEKK